MGGEDDGERDGMCIFKMLSFFILQSRSFVYDY